MRALRRKRAPGPARRLRPANLEAQYRDVHAFIAARATEATDEAERAVWTDTDAANLVLIRDMYGPEIWPEDADVHAERAEDVAVLDEYRAMIG
ncbi:hypothetical protein [Nocardiopsis sp. TNDT3]|uniref:hypothetical protein n=1 Tax=Nocardiopsis sp. TNDT3 TaxID=2249354 RepID=UPI000E3D1F3A|nr:hypothetical protein [Nocardiopsis sp. TNDT3]